MGSWVDARPSGKAVSDGTYNYTKVITSMSPDRNKAWFINRDTLNNGGAIFTDNSGTYAYMDMYFTTNDKLPPGTYRFAIVLLQDIPNRQYMNRTRFYPCKGRTDIMKELIMTEAQTAYITATYSEPFEIPEEIMYHPYYDFSFDRNNDSPVLFGLFLERWEENPSNQLVTSGYIDDGDE